jgi:hypothetical protein
VPGERANAVGEVALHDLHMVEIELQFQVGVPNPLDDRHRLGRGVEKIARNVAGVDRLDDDRDPFAGEPLGGVLQVCDIGALGFGAVCARRPKTRYYAPNGFRRRLVSEWRFGRRQEAGGGHERRE